MSPSGHWRRGRERSARDACRVRTFVLYLPQAIPVDLDNARSRDMAQLNPYIFFSGNCRDAMTFYQSCLGGELNIQTVGESPAAAQMPAEAHNGVIHSMLQGGGVTIMASDN